MEKRLLLEPGESSGHSSWEWQKVNSRAVPGSDVSGSREQRLSQISGMRNSTLVTSIKERNCKNPEDCTLMLDMLTAKCLEISS